MTVLRILVGVVRALDRRATTRILLTGLLIAAICFYFGADVWHSILIGGALATLGLIGLIANDNPDFGNTGWKSDSRSDRRGARRDVAELSSSLRGSYGRVRSAAVLQAQRLARRRLTPYQLDLLDPADRPMIEQIDRSPCVRSSRAGRPSAATSALVRPLPRRAGCARSHTAHSAAFQGATPVPELRPTPPEENS